MPLEIIEKDNAKINIDGQCASRFASVLQAFGENFRSLDELGAGLCVYHEGEKVVDIWGGYCDPERSKPWEQDTIVSMASVFKGMMSFCIHRLAYQGRISYDAPVAAYWPEFAQSGKSEVTVRQAISHHAALQFTDAAEPGDILHWDKYKGCVEQQAPEWEPGKKGVYHTFSIAPIIGGLVEAVTGQRIWDYFRAEIAEPLGVDYQLSLTEAEHQRLCPDYNTDAFQSQISIDPSVLQRFFKPVGDLSSLIGGKNVPIQGCPNLGSAGNARGVARIFAYASMGGTLDGIEFLSPDIIDEFTQEQWNHPCPIWGMNFRHALGLLLNQPDTYFGPNPNAFGTAGAGESFGMADRENKISIGYCLNSWYPDMAIGSRAKKLIDSVYTCI